MFDPLNNPIIHFIGQYPEETVVLKIKFFSFFSHLIQPLVYDLDLFLNEIVQNNLNHLRFLYFKFLLLFYIHQSLLLSHEGSYVMQALV